ncbi:hypothetical protein EDB84DRAFT_1474495 [Lactarius hengduanensis]|nr:hypothetical protein EDB84DRAFT_1474495 [Lactarius hengduanensis]
MKDFKSRVIDAPRVIRRVATLFHGHPFLIQDTTPSGTMLRSTNTPSISAPPPSLSTPLSKKFASCRHRTNLLCLRRSLLHLLLDFPLTFRPPTTVNGRL